MNELIWVGNTLYPRWFVIAVPIVIIVMISIVGVMPFVVVWVWKRVRWCVIYCKVMWRYRRAKRDR